VPAASATSSVNESYGAVELLPGDEAALHHRLIAIDGVLRLHQPRHGGGDIGAGGIDGVLRGLRIEPRDDLPRPHWVADIHRARDELTADAKRQVDGVLGLDGTGQRDRLTAADLDDLGDAHRPNRLRRRHLGGRVELAAAEQQRGSQGHQGEESASNPRRKR